MDSDSFEDYELKLVSDVYRGPSISQIHEFRKEFEKRLKWRKSRYINEHVLLQEKRILSEMQHTNAMNMDLSNAAYRLDTRRLQAQEVFMNALNHKSEPPATTSLGSSNRKRTNYPSSFKKANDSSDNDSDNYYDNLATQARNPSISRFNAPSEGIFRKESNNNHSKSNKPVFNKNISNKSGSGRVPLKRIG